MGNEVFIESLLKRGALAEVGGFPGPLSSGNRRLLGLLGQVIEYYFEQDAEQRFTEVVFPLGIDSWFTGDAFRGHRFWDIDPSSQLNFAAWSEYRKKFLARAHVRDLGFRQQLSDGRIRHYRIHASPVWDVDGNFAGYDGVVTDVSELRYKDAYVETVEHAAIGIAHISGEGRFTFVNRKLCEILGYEREELVGMHVNQLSHEDDMLLVGRQRQHNNACIRVEKRYRRKNGDYIWVRLNITEVESGDEDWGFDISVVEDITDRIKAEENFKYLATHDELTSLPNRMLFTHLLRHGLDGARRYSRQLAVMLIDLDRFKTIIDSLGHAAGDFVLQEMAQRFRNAVRGSDVVARLGGDEFIVLLQEVNDREHLARIAGVLLQRAMEPVKLANHECRLSASIGIAVYPEDGDDDAGLLRRADQALYIAKAEGKNNFQFCPPEIEGASVGRIRMEALLHHAIANNELSLHFQGKVELLTNRVVGAEALLRWRNPELGDVSPALFVPLVEELELIFPIGRWVIDRACAQMRQWRRDGHTIASVAVNLSPRQFADPELIGFIETSLRKYGLPGSTLELEITEGVVMQRPEKALQTLRAIKALGVRIAIDDFGTGFSSLGQLKRFPVDTLKIDRTFIHEIEHDEGDKALTRAIITMAKNLGLAVVAEGVETPGQATYLRQHGCDMIQGYYFSKPCGAGEFEKLLAA
ncbi:MAG TPA: EAL domain-containing protein [Candidatus Acidoferrum sp.]|nr:EAL domain-containing protein [Candidatus Acidoferrum sp.]